MRGTTPTEDDTLGCFEEGTITKVTPYGDGGGWSVSYGDRYGCGVKNCGVTPKVGDHLRVYGRFGQPFHGQAINGVMLWYKTEAEMQADHAASLAQRKIEQGERFEKDRERLDRDYEALPWVLRKRIDRFRAANPNFRVEYESYEMFTCTQAALLASWAEGQTDPVAAVDEWNALGFDDQLSAVPGWSDGHSGNTHGCAVALAKTMLTSTERAAVMPGAMSPLVGTADYSPRP